MTERSPSEPSESSETFEEEILGALSVIIYNGVDNSGAGHRRTAEWVLNYLRSKGLINNG